MADNDFFVDEVSEDVRKDQGYKLLRKYRFVLIAVVVGAVGLVGMNEWRKSNLRKSGEAEFSLLASDLNSDENAVVNLQNVNNPSLLVQLKLAELLQKNGDIEGATSVLQELKASSDVPKVIGELAQWRIVGMNEDAPIGVLANPGSSYEELSKLVEAERALGGGDEEQAIAKLQELAASGRANDLLPAVEALLLRLGGDIPETEGGDVLQNDDQLEDDGGL